MSKTDVLDLLGLCLLAMFGYACWAPLCLLVFGLGALAHSWSSERTPAGGDS